MRIIVLAILSTAFLLSCNTELNDPQLIIDRAIETSGGTNYQQFEIEFDFRDRHYISKRDFGNFEYQRITTDSLGQTIDVYSNEKAFSRTINGNEINMPDSLSGRIENSINSVNYFVLLPYGLNDEAVNKTYIGESEIKGEGYHKLRITFSEEGGGSDFEDVFVYWIHKENYTVDYLAYRYFTDGGGWRFREAYNPRTIGGLRFVDYRNYKPNSEEAVIEGLDADFESGKLKLLSLIETENISVR